jgi:hypothetical protein
MDNKSTNNLVSNFCSARGFVQESEPLELVGRHLSYIQRITVLGTCHMIPRFLVFKNNC